MKEAQVPLDVLGVSILIFTGVMVIAGMVIYIRVNRKQVGRFLFLLRIVFISNAIYQIASIIYFMVSPDLVPTLLSGTLNLAAGNIYGLCVTFLNVSILEAFKVLTNLEPYMLIGFKLTAVILLILSQIFFLAPYYFGVEQLLPYCRIPFILYGGYIILFNNCKTIYILRLLYLDRLNNAHNNGPERSKTAAKYSKLNLFFVTIFVLDLFAMTIWAFGHVTAHPNYIKIGETLAGVELLFYPRLICGFRDLRFDQLELKSARKNKTEGGTPSVHPILPKKGDGASTTFK